MATSQRWCLLLMVLLVGLFNSEDVRAAVTDKPPFYQINYQDKTAYLLGSIHVGREDFYPMAPQIEAVFAKAGALVVEVDVTQADAVNLIRRYGLTSQQQDEATTQRMASFCQANEATCSALKPYAPWMQAMQLGVMRFDALGYQAQWGLEQILTQKNGQRPVIELESGEFQFELMASFDPQVQWEMVFEAIDAPDEEMLALITAWRTGDETAIDQLMVGQMQQGDDTHLIDKMLWQRNQAMSRKIADLMTQDTTPAPLFIVVGAGHVVGDKSIGAIMQQQFKAKLQNCWQQACD
ncbi:TraB/GumN family protein [Shewanella algidipiscicola]|uniref:TraB/GumN family protein n=1 Tax=Shewanella algidipiscicola TaxID=614070 RepID=UPI000D785439|nr:TraB/GumN family protein [Shewanella algidipiscicola]